MDKWNHRITEVVRDILTPKNGDNAISFSFLTSFLCPYLRVFDHLCCGESIFLCPVPCFLFHHHTYLDQSVCLSPYLPARGIDVEHRKPCHGLLFLEQNKSPPSSSPLMSLVPLCQLRC